ncbi:FAD-dependent monooxygenase [Spelaeicoccus albus]|uniref:2-polyprenyl-6-methoxyphenol hydroxylase-like FAD-dependent oxidoreductase n=1 Tax=Spelaeicoccus albus TaxID=1280376 RepID=A0A7Z0ABD8_9MICO|nr:FAD-dependent monooxygenase [Spelaeicoccus albus]NYI66740.1 2-polyprenyl-6-methoxyphenol hydroxylase-like FAD-dependent oxidoreductase [Spelaeicoccus albus]
MITDTLFGLPGHAPIVIVGGGPSGLFLSLDLARYGVPSVVLDGRRHIDANRPRAKTTNTRTMTHLRRLGLAESLRRAAPLPVDYSEDVIFCTSATGYELTRFHEAFQLHRGRYDLQPESGQQVGQPVVETVLREAVAAEPLVTAYVGARVDSIDTPDGGYRLFVRHDDGRRSISADYLVGADGGSSVVRKSIGLRLEGSSAARSNLNVLFRSRELADTITLDKAVQYWITNPAAPGMLGPLDLDGTWWTILQGVDSDDVVADPVPSIRAMVGAEIDIDVIEKDPWTARMLLADHYRSGNAFLVGDAAHLNPPWGGHGFNTCIGDAANLAWKLAASVKGWAGPVLLNSYEAERRPVAARTIRDAAANGNSLAYDFADAELLDDGPAGQAARDAAAANLVVKTSEFHSLGLVLGYEYSDSPLSGKGDVVPPSDPVRYTPSAAPGCLLPHTWLADGSSIYDMLGPGFTLLYEIGRIPTGQPEELSLAAGRYGIPLTVRAITESCSVWGVAAVLVRPDQHTVWRGSDLFDREGAGGAESALTALVRAAGVPDGDLNSSTTDRMKETAG